DALVSGTSDAAVLAQLARGRLREKIPQLEQALAGQFSAHQRFLIAQHLAHIDFLDASLERVTAEVADRLRPFERSWSDCRRFQVSAGGPPRCWWTPHCASPLVGFGIFFGCCGRRSSSLLDRKPGHMGGHASRRLS